MQERLYTSLFQLMYEFAYTGVSDPRPFELYQDRSPALVGDVLVLPAPGNWLDAIARAACFLGTLPARSDILDWMCAQSISLLSGRGLALS